MSSNEIEQTLLAHYVANGANELTAAPRFYPRGELVLIVEDKILVGARPFGIKVRGRSRAAAELFLDHMIEAGAWSTKTNDFGGTMHQFQPDAYKAVLKAWQDSDPVIARARAGADSFWADTFAALSA
jgi:hypothetical protein